MTTPISRPDVARELSRLKDFQRDTVEYVFQRMYRDSTPQRRFLVADEVGLGKTMVARGVVARVVDELWETVDRIDVIYICSNGSIARQNVNRLNILDVKAAALPSRITLLPKVVHGLQERKVNFISLTPQTSFDLRSSLGTSEERALLHRLLPESWRDVNGSKNALEGSVERDRFRRRLSDEASVPVDVTLLSTFRARLDGEATLRADYDRLCAELSAGRRYEHFPAELRTLQRAVVGSLRLGLATSCLQALEPDLIVVDEFQRFKALLDGTDQAGELARSLFAFGRARVLLLSATPYKMYTSSDDETDDHYKDFLQTVAFLQDDQEVTTRFKESLEGYRQAIFHVGRPGADQELRARQSAVEDELRRVMVRTERLAVEADRNGMLTEVTSRAELHESDVSALVSMSRIARAIEQPEVIEYWKSAPYLLNFMDDYQFKESFVDGLRDRATAAEIGDALQANPASLLSWDAVERFSAVDPQNARVRALVDETMESGWWRLLWLPPALPYYRPAGAFADAGHVTKRLIFSSWHVVPKAVASLLSYEAERRMTHEGGAVGRPNTPEERKKRQGLLRFVRRDGALANMSVLGLLYPSITLAELADPLEAARANATLTLEEAVAHAERQIAIALGELPAYSEAAGETKELWYWAAPILLDLHRHPDAARTWWQQADLADVWQQGPASVDVDDDGAEDAWTAHVTEARRLLDGGIELGRPPADLTQVLATMALGGFGTVSVRALARISGGITAVTDPVLRNEAGWIAWALRTLFNLPEVTALVRAFHPGEPYWLRVAEYAAAGCLQSVLDEYAHVLLEYEGVAHRPAAEATRHVAKTMALALQLRTANVGVDDVVVDQSGPRIEDKRHMRSRFAVRFGATQREEGAAAARQDDVRTSFNSPFWPFVLCSTSVGQEGLDFHLYCHAVVHWNLPSNPVDLEQREGRVHRYKGHAVRRNAAMLHGRDALADGHADPWEVVFEHAVTSRSATENDLTPFWVLPVEGGATIERHVPALPHSRDRQQLATLRRSLALYRMAFGQNRQDDVLAYLRRKCSPEQLALLSTDLRVDLAPRAEAAPRLPFERRRVVRTHATGSVKAWRDGIAIDVATLRTLLEEWRVVQGRAALPAADRYRALLDRFVQLAQVEEEPRVGSV